MTSNTSKRVTSLWLSRLGVAVIAAISTTLIVAAGPLVAEAAPVDYSIEVTAPTHVPASSGFAYNVTISAPEASATAPSTGITLSAQLPAGIAFDSVPHGASEVVSNVSYNEPSRVATFTLGDLTDTLSSFVFTVTQNNNSQKDANTVFDTTLTGTPIAGGAIPSAQATTRVTGELSFRPIKTNTTLTGGNNRDVTYYFNAQSTDSTATTGVFTSWAQRFTDVLPANSEVTNTFSNIGGTWNITGTPATGQTVIWQRDNTSLGSPANYMDTVGQQLGITVRYPASDFPTGTRPPENTTTMEMRTYTGDWESLGTASTQGPAFLGDAEKFVSISTNSNQSNGAKEFTWGSGQWIANFGVNAAFINDLDDESLQQMTVEDSASQSAANASFYLQSDVFRVGAQFNATLQQANVPYDFQYMTTDGAGWKSYGQGLTTSAELRLNTVNAGSTGFTESDLDDTLFIPIGERITGWRVVLSPGASDAEVPPSSEVRVTTNYVPLSQLHAGPVERYSNTAVGDGKLSSGSTLPTASSAAQPSVADRVPIVTQITENPTTLTVDSPTSYGVNISNMDPASDYRDSVLKFVLPVGVFYDPAIGVSRDYSTTPTTNVDVPSPGTGLEITTESVSDARGEHEVVVFNFDNLENLREIGQPKNRIDTFGFRYHIPVNVLAQAYDPAQGTTQARGFAYTNDATFAAVEMGYYPTFFASDSFDFDPNLDAVAYSSSSSTVATSGGLLIGKTVRESDSDAWTTNAMVAPDGTNLWQIFVSNALTDPVTDAVIFDRLPQAADGRNSDFAATLVSQVTGAPANSTVEYSADASSATDGTWTSSPDGAVALRVTVPSIAAGENFALRFTSRSDTNMQAFDDVAYNVVDTTVNYHGAERQFTSNIAQIAAVANPSISMVKKTNGVEYSGAPGAQVAQGSDVVWTYEITNTGDTPVNELAIVDTFTTGTGESGTQTPLSEVDGILLPGDTRTFTATASAVTGQYHNTATATAKAVDSVGNTLNLPVLPATDESWYFAGATGLAVVKTTNGSDVVTSPGLFVAPGSAITWEYAITNTGVQPLSNVAIADVDDTGASVFADTIATLSPGETVRLSETGTAIKGQYHNTVNVAADNPLGGAALTAADDSYYFGVEAGLEIYKQVSASVNGPWVDKVTIDPGDSVYWRFTVTNTGNINLTDVVLTDKNLGNIDSVADLPVGSSVERTLSQANVTKSYTNVAIASVTDAASLDHANEDTAVVQVRGDEGLSLTGAASANWIWAVLLLGVGAVFWLRSRRLKTS